MDEIIKKKKKHEKPMHGGKQRGSCRTGRQATRTVQGGVAMETEHSNENRHGGI